MKFGYARVSGLSQDLAQQKEQLVKNGVDEDNIYAEKFTGTTEQRPKWQKLNKQLRKDDEVVFTKDAMGKMLFNFLTIMAEFEHDMIVDRLAQGKAYAKAHNPNYHEGRPKRRITNRYRKIYELSKEHSIKETAEISGVSESTVKRIRKQIRDEQQ